MRVEEEEHYSNQVASKGFDPNEVKRRIEEQKKKKEERMEQLRKEKELKELEGCTFAPKIAKKVGKQGGNQEEVQTNAQPRDLNTFLED